MLWQCVIGIRGRGPVIVKQQFSIFGLRNDDGMGGGEERSFTPENNE